MRWGLSDSGDLICLSRFKNHPDTTFDPLTARLIHTMHIAIVDEELPYPLNSGKRIRTFQLVSRLARRHRITYICHRNADPDEAEQAATAFRDLGIETIVVDRPVPPKSGLAFYGRLAANLLSPFPTRWPRTEVIALGTAIPEVACTDGGGPLAGRVDALRRVAARTSVGAQRLIMAHNVESQIWKTVSRERDQSAQALVHRPPVAEIREFRAAGLPGGRPGGGRQPRGRRADPRPLRRSARGGRRERRRHDLLPARIGRTAMPGQILFLGSLDWRPNLDAVDQLLATVFPAVRAQEPSARLCLVGRNPPEALQRRVQATPGVELHANVPDVRPFLAPSALMVVPLRIGGGSRLKILEAFAAGLPVVSTRIGAEGLNVENGSHLTVVENVEEMAEAIVASSEIPRRPWPGPPAGPAAGRRRSTTGSPGRSARPGLDADGFRYNASPCRRLRIRVTSGVLS